MTARRQHAMCTGSITWALDSDPVNLIPFGGVSSANMRGKEPMYDSLLEWDQDLQIQPALAESYEVDDDATSYTFTLRQGVLFHNGQEMTAEDVKYSLETAVNPPAPGIQVACSWPISPASRWSMTTPSRSPWRSPIRPCPACWPGRATPRSCRRASTTRSTAQRGHRHRPLQAGRVRVERPRRLHLQRGLLEAGRALHPGRHPQGADRRAVAGGRAALRRDRRRHPHRRRGAHSGER